MKKTMVGILLLVSVVGTGFAVAGPGYKGCTGINKGAAMTQEQRDEMTSFRLDNAEIFKGIAQARAELKAVYSAPTPDIEKAGQLAGELFELRGDAKDAALAAGIEKPMHKGKRGHGSNLDEATLAKVTEFKAANKELSKQLTVKKAEQKALMMAENPSPEEAKRLAGEVFDLRTELTQKAIDAGLPAQCAMAGKDRGHDGKGKRGGDGMNKNSKHHRGFNQDVTN